MKHLMLLASLYLLGIYVNAQNITNPNFDSLLNAAHQQTRRALADELLYRIKTEKPDRTTTFRLAQYAHRIDKDNNKIFQVLLDCAYGDTSSWHRTIAGHGHWVFALAFSPDGSKIISAGADDKLKIWDAKTLKELNSVHIGATAFAIDFSPDGTKIALGLLDSTVTVYDSHDYRELFKLKGHSDILNDVAFSPDGTKIISGGDDGFVRLWDVATQSLLFSFEVDKYGTESVAFSPDGNKIISGGYEGILRVWDTKTHGLLASIEIDTTRARSIFKGTDAVVFSPNGLKILASVWEREGAVRSWDATTYEPLSTFKAHKYSPDFLFYSPDGTKLISGSSDQTIKFWDAENHELLTEIKNIPSQFLSITISPDGNKIACGAGRNLIQVNDLTKKQNLSHLETYENERFVAFSPDGKKMITKNYFDYHGRLAIWDTQKKDSLLIIDLGPYGATVLDVTDGFEILLTGNNKGDFRFWNLNTGNKIGSFETNEKGIMSAKFSNDTSEIMTCHRNGKIARWDIKTGKLLSSFQIGNFWRAPPCIKLTGENSKMLALSFYNKTIKIFDSNKNELSVLPDAIANHGQSSDMDKLIVIPENEAMQLWDVKAGEMLFTVEGKINYLNPIFTPDSSKFISDKKVYDANTGIVAYAIPDNEYRGWNSIWTNKNPNQLLVFGGYRLSHFWLNSDSLIKEVIEKYNPGYLRPFEIEKYELEKSFEFAGFTNKELIEQGNEHTLLSVADYYTQKAEQLNMYYKLAETYLEKAVELYEALENIAVHNLKDTYTQRKEKALSMMKK